MIVTSFVEYITGRLMERYCIKSGGIIQIRNFIWTVTFVCGYLLYGACAVYWWSTSWIRFLRSCQYDTPFDRRSDLMGAFRPAYCGWSRFGNCGSWIERKKGRIEQITEELQKTSKFLENALTKRIQKRLVKAFPNIETEKDAEQEEKFAEGCGFLNWRVCLSSEHLSGI